MYKISCATSSTISVSTMWTASPTKVCCKINGFSSGANRINRSLILMGIVQAANLHVWHSQALPCEHMGSLWAMPMTFISKVYVCYIIRSYKKAIKPKMCYGYKCKLVYSIHLHVCNHICCWNHVICISLSSFFYSFNSYNNIDPCYDVLYCDICSNDVKNMLEEI